MDLWRTAVVGESADTRSCDAVSCASLMPVRCVSLQAVHPARWFDAVRLPYAKSASQGGERGRRGSMWVLNSGEDQCGGLVWAENGTAGFVTARALRRHRHDELVTAMSPVHAALCLCAGPRLVPMRVGVRGHQRRPALVSLWFSSSPCAFASEDTSADAYAICTRRQQQAHAVSASVAADQGALPKPPSSLARALSYNAWGSFLTRCLVSTAVLGALLSRCLVLVSSVVCRATRDGVTHAPRVGPRPP